MFTQKLHSMMSIDNYPITILLVFGFAFSSDILLKILSKIFKLKNQNNSLIISHLFENTSSANSLFFSKYLKI